MITVSWPVQAVIERSARAGEMNMPAAAYVLAIDQGTTNTRALVYDARGQVAGSAVRELTQHYPREGWVEHDPEEIWSSTVAVVKEAVAAAAQQSGQIAAVGLTNQRETVVLW